MGRKVFFSMILVYGVVGPRTYFVIESDSSVKSDVVKNVVYVREKKSTKHGLT